MTALYKIYTLEVQFRCLVIKVDSPMSIRGEVLRLCMDATLKDMEYI